MLHLCKLAVGVRNPAHLAEIQTAQGIDRPRHRTRNMPRQAAEIVAGGSMYWVMGGLMCVRQRIVAITPDCWDDGLPCTSLFFEPDLVAVAPRTMKAFQGWRYLTMEQAPVDLAVSGDAAGADALPHELQRALRALCLL